MAGGEHSRRDALLHGKRQLEQADRVADLGARPPDAARELLLGDAEVREQLLVRRRLLERVQLGAVQVLEQGVAQQVLVGRVADDRGDRGEPGLARGTGATLAHDELVRAVTDVAHDDGLQHAELADAVDELGEIVGVEVRARLTRDSARSRADRSARDARRAPR